ncbi:MAG: leucyl/phenylalanyl-tRNA--protein transferase [Mariprofundaceae bacterium]|nr:leucyl/phenylalanyl-tRNA--protein transferase [Mariprofundaceae bacterium]
MGKISPEIFNFPPPEEASADGLLAFGGSLCEEALLQAYQQGIFPWYDDKNPIIWWSPDPRMILFPDDFHTSKRLSRRIKQKKLQMSHDQAFREVMLACAQPRKDQDSTWIISDMVDAYCTMFERGHGFSIEIWEEGQLCGGVYGLHIGKAWFAESMFHTRIDASKIALFHLVERVKSEHGHFIDCQMHTSHLASLGAKEISRSSYLELLAKATA